MKKDAVAITPSAVARLPEDIRAATQAVYALGTSGYAWFVDGSVCVLMNSGSGGCLQQFIEPSVVFLSASPAGYMAEGVVPDQVTKLSLVLADGETVPVKVYGNAFSVRLPEGAVIAGEQVGLSNGTTFFNEDHVTVN